MNLGASINSADGTQFPDIEVNEMSILSQITGFRRAQPPVFILR